MDQRLSRKERLKSKTLIQALFEQGKRIKAFPVHGIWLVSDLPHPDIEVQLGISVPKRIHKLAVTRNRIKRLLREAYRKNKHLLDTKGTTFAVMLIYTAKEIPSQEETSKAVCTILKRMNDAIPSDS